MPKERSICKRCHRLRVVNNARYCADCNEVLRADERPKQRLSQLSTEADAQELDRLTIEATPEGNR